MDNEKDTQKTINNLENQNQNYGQINTNDSIEVNNLINLTNADITPDILEQLEAKAIEEQKKLDQDETLAQKDNEVQPIQQDIQIIEGLPAENGAINVTADILERPIEEEPILPVIQNKDPEKLDPLEEAKLNAVYKKYVIYINPENERFIDSLSIAERKKLINDVLYEQNMISEAQRRERQRNENIIKTLLCIVTFLIAVPVIYLIFNVSMEATIQNYRHSKTNFEVLYKETGKIKLNK